MAIETGSFAWFEPPQEALAAVHPMPLADASRHHRLAANILDSYSRPMDLLAEALQNATDAIDTRSEHDDGAPRRIEIVFDAQKMAFAVTDTGVGLPLHELRLALAPNITFKVGELARPRKFRARGEKGVGLSFMALACDHLTIRTCDGSRVIDASIDGANTWLHASTGRPAPMCVYRIENRPGRLMDSERWTTVTVARIAHAHFGANLFEMPAGELVWRLRTETAVGNTAHLFDSIAHEQPSDIVVSLRYTSRRGTEVKARRVPYKFFSPAELLSAEQIVDFDDVKNLSPFERRRRLRGKALRYVARKERSNERFVDVYLDRAVASGTGCFH